MDFFVRHLPKSIITSNRTSQGAAGARGKWAERAELQAETHQAIIAKYAPDVPSYQCASLTLTYCMTKKRPGDGLYRPKDVPNIGGDILKAVCDAAVYAGVLPDDEWKYLPAIGLGFEYVDEVALEGILVTVEPLGGAA